MFVVLKQHSQADQDDQQGRWVRCLQIFPVIEYKMCLTLEQLAYNNFGNIAELHLCNTAEGSQTYSLSFWSCGSLRPRHTSVSFLSLLSWGSNKTNKTWVSLLSLGTRISTQTGQPRRPLKEEEKRRREGGEGEEVVKEARSLTVVVFMTGKDIAILQQVQVGLSVQQVQELLAHPETGTYLAGGGHLMHYAANNRHSTCYI